MLFVLTATILCAITVFSMKTAVFAGPKIEFVGFDWVGIAAGLGVFALATAFFSPVFAFSLIATFLLHEFGHVVGHRIAGHDDVRFRLVPLVSPQPVTDFPVKSEGQAFMIAIMGAGISVGPMALAFAMAAMLADYSPADAKMFHTFAVTCGAVNFLYLMPFWPLDGGHCTRLFAKNFWPSLAPGMTVFMASMFLAAGIRTGSIILLIFAAIGAQSLFRKGVANLVPMGPHNALTAMSAYTFTMAAHFSGGYWLLSQYFH